MRREIPVFWASTVLVVALSLAHAPAAPGDALLGASAPGVVGPLRTRGNKIIDGRGRPIMLRGVMREWLNRFPTLAGSWLDDVGLNAAKRWGANAVRIAVGEAFWLRDCDLHQAYRQVLDTAVRNVTSRGMVAVLDLHWGSLGSCQGGWLRMPDEGSKAFWADAAVRYRDNPLVIFQLYNEPHDISWDTWRNGGTVHEEKQVYEGGSVEANGWTFRSPGMQQLYNIIRRTGARNLVLVNGNEWSHKPPPREYWIRGYNIVYGVHAFVCPHYPPPYCSAPTPYDPRFLSERTAELLPRHPVIIDEFGWPAPTDGEYNRRTIDWAERHRVGWIAFDWSPMIEPWALFTDPVTFEPTLSGAPVKVGLARNFSVR
jgi:endoglucanase